MKINWKGVYPAVTTKFTADDELDIKTTARGLKAQLDGKGGQKCLKKKIPAATRRKKKH